MNKNMNILKVAITSVLSFALIIGVTYALIKFNFVGNKDNTILVGGLKFNYNETSSSMTITNNDILSNTEGMKSDNYFDFNVSLEKQTTTGVSYNILLTSDNTNNLSNIKAYLTEVKNNTETKLIDPTTLNNLTKVNNNMKLYSDIIDPNKTKYYRLRLWVDENFGSSQTTSVNGNTSTGTITGFTFKFVVSIGVDNTNVETLDTSGANKPVLASNMIPVYYDEASETWKKADVSNTNKTNPWYSYNSSGEYKGMWANAVTVKDTNRQTYLNATPGTTISMDDIITMWVWIPRFKVNTTDFDAISGEGSCLETSITTKEECVGRGVPWVSPNPGAIDVTFVKQNETAIDAFTFGNKELSGFWYGKFEVGHTTLASSTTSNNLGCTNETCSNANGIIIKPNVRSLRYNNISNFFFASRSMEQSGNSFGFVSAEVDTHMSKNNEWGAVAYLTQSIYGRCTNSTTCSEVGINSIGFTTGHGAPAGSDDSVTNGAYNTALGKDASTTKNIYGIYDMSGGAWEYVMGVLADPSGKPRSGYYLNNNSGFTGMLADGTTYTGIAFPDSKYYNLYTGDSYTGHALTETAGWYSDDAYFIVSSKPWFRRGGYWYDQANAGVFYFGQENGNYDSSYSSRFVISNE